MPESSEHRFHVDLRGLIDLLSHHLYSGPEVFVREQLQNAVDAIQARRKIDPDYVGEVQIELVRRPGSVPTVLFEDDGIGLTEREIHEFLATIGQSSKRGEALVSAGGFLGQFGIGLLSGFMVCDEIVVITRSAKEPGQPSMEWRGHSNGTYSVRALDREVPVGTRVFLRAKDARSEFFEPATLLALTRHYGEFLDPTIRLAADGTSEQVNTAPPWGLDIGREALLDYGERTFEQRFSDVIPLRSAAGDVEGVAYVLAQATHPGARGAHRVYLKNMLLSTKADNLLPDWAFFVQCVVNASSLTPTASRESFYEDESLLAAQTELADCLRGYLLGLARNDPRRLEQFIAVHHMALKALATEDDECLEVFSDWLPFETSMGTMTFGEFRRANRAVRYVPSRDQFRQIAPVAASESLAVINAGYAYDVEILERIGAIRSDLDVQPFEVNELSDRFEELTLEEREATVAFERLADAVLQPYKCAVELSRFRPAELPALYVANANAEFLRSIESSQEVADDVWSGVLGNMAGDITSTFARLYLNYGNPLVRRVAALADREAATRCVEMMYIQALLLGHFPLKQKEVGLLNQGLLGLINWALDASQGEEP